MPLFSYSSIPLFKAKFVCLLFDSSTMTIRKGIQSDLPAVFALVQELAIYENALDKVNTSVAQYTEDGFGAKPLFEFFVAEDEKAGVVGIAFFYIGYSTWKGKILYLDDLVITDRFRKRGIGKHLMDTLVRYGREQKVNQIRWHVLDWNEPAIRLYKKLGAELDPEWITCKLNRDQIDNWGEW